jgi:mannose-6-phosphate isomerase-like protein (cupin superfamily)
MLNMKPCMFFFVLNGKFIVDLEGRSVELLPNQGFVVPKGAELVL